MTDRLQYWIDLFVTACGLESAGEYSVVGVVAVAAAAAVLVYAAYRALTATLWPGETDPDHIKHHFVRDGEDGDAD